MRTGREYLRVSKDRSGRMRSPSEQHDDNAAAAAERDVQLGDPYLERRAVGASRYSKGTRDDFARLLADLTTGAFAADELWLWEPSRGSREVGEWVALIGACEHAKVHLYVTTHRKAYDAGNARDRRSLLEDAVDAEYESAKTSERVNRAVRARAVAGRPHGKLLYGYARQYDPKTKAYLRTIIDPVAGPVMAEMYRRYADGEGITQIATSLTKRGVATPQGAAVWRWPTIANLLRNEGHLGRRVSRAGHATVEDAWPPLVDETTWWRVQARFRDKGGPVRQDRAVKYVLSGVAVCGVCGGRMQHNAGRSAKAPRAYPTYICHDRRCVSRSARHLEALVVEWVLTLHEGDARVGRSEASPELAALEAEHAGLAAKLDDWQAAGARPDGPSPAAVARVERELTPQIEALAQRIAEARATWAMPDLEGKSLREAWPGLSVARRRDIIAATVTIRVLRAGQGKRFDPASVEITRRW